jgi:hypothetical protein
MIQSQIDDLQEIFNNHIGTYIFDVLVETLDSFLAAHPAEVILKTRNDQGLILSFGNVKYFSLISPAKAKPVICAGAAEPNYRKNPIPVIRFSNSNPRLREIPHSSLFPYSKPGWTYVHLHGETILALPHLLEEQLNIFYERPGASSTVVGKESRPMKNEADKVDDSPNEMFSVVIIILGIIIGLYGLINLPLGGGLFPVILGFVIVAIGGALVPEQTKSNVSFEEARYLLFGRGNPPKANPDRTYNYSSSEHEESIHCPRCHSSQISTIKRGFKVGRAIGAGLATGAIGGIVAGAAGKNKILIVCLKCKHQWSL